MIDAFRVGLLITERCDVECDHCWFGSGPYHGSTMKLEEISGYVDQASDIPTVEWISITGGEPFLFPELLEYSVRRASDLGLMTECVTNCRWAETERIADETLRGLVEAGLDVINLSADDFHQRHIPFERVGNAYRSARGLGLRVVVMCATSRSGILGALEVKRRLGDEDIRIVGTGEKGASTPAIIVEDGFTPVGRGAEISRGEWLEGGPFGGGCGLVLRDIGVSPSGMVLPCCSSASLVEDMALGNAGEDSLSRLLEAASWRPIFKALRTEGPLAMARRMDIEESDYVNRCHLCHGVLTDPRLDEVLEALVSITPGS